MLFIYNQRLNKLSCFGKILYLFCPIPPTYPTVAPELRMETAPRNLVPRPYFTGSENISDFQEKLEEYFLVNKIANDDKLVILKCSLKANAKIWFDTIGSTFLGPS